MAERSAEYGVVPEDVEQKKGKLRTRIDLADIGQQVTIFIAVASAAVGIYRLAKRDGAGALASGGVSLASGAAAMRLRRITNDYIDEKKELGNPQTITGKDRNVIKIPVV